MHHKSHKLILVC